MPTTRLGKGKEKEEDKKDKGKMNSKKDDVPEVGLQIEPHGSIWNSGGRITTIMRTS